MRSFGRWIRRCVELGWGLSFVEAQFFVEFLDWSPSIITRTHRLISLTSNLVIQTPPATDDTTESFSVRLMAKYSQQGLR